MSPDAPARNRDDNGVSRDEPLVTLYDSGARSKNSVISPVSPASKLANLDPTDAGTGRHFHHRDENNWEHTIMGSDTNRELVVEKGTVQCLSEKRETLDHCRFCIHCREFKTAGQWVKSPSLAYCTKCRVTEEVDLKKIEAVRCADRQGEGYHSMMSIIG